MLSGFYPEDYVSSVYIVDFNKLKQDGYKAVLFDIDNTLVPHNAPADKRAMDFFGELKRLGYKTCMISNNREPRVKLFCEAVGGDYYEYLAKKPSSKAYLKACSTLGVSPEEAIFVGDQLFTDILGAKNTGIRNIMVMPILKWKEPPQIVLKRFLEAFVLFFYKIRLNRAGAARPVPVINKEDL